jgi:hypothetical protein
VQSRGRNLRRFRHFLDRRTGRSRSQWRAPGRSSVRHDLTCWVATVLIAVAGSSLPTAAQQPVTIKDCGGLKSSFTFDNAVEVAPGQTRPYPRLSDAQKDAFTAAFCLDVANLTQWLYQVGWSLSSTLPDLEVSVSDRFRISRALLHMALNEPGKIDVPAPEVVIGRAAMLHELVHVFLPNGNRLLAEGLAVYLQQKIGRNQAFPNFSRPLHEMVRMFTCSGNDQGVDTMKLERIRFGDADKIATPSPIWLRVGLIPYSDAAYVYPMAGSLVEFLIETRGVAKFRTLYSRTPLVPLGRDPGHPDRWIDVYGVSLTGLEAEWRALIGSLSCPQ